MYKFVYVSLDKVPSVRGWYLLIEPLDNIGISMEEIGLYVPKSGSVLEESLDKWLQSYAQRYFSDKHMNIEHALKRSDNDNGKHANIFFSTISHPCVLDGIKRANIIKHLSQGRTILINSNGGYSFLDGYTILETVIKDEMIFPKNENVTERIIISRYPGCKHYYLSSNIGGRIFNNNAFFTKKMAREEALKYTDENNIIEREDTFMYTRSGD